MILDRSDQNAPNQASRFTSHVRALKEKTLKNQLYLSAHVLGLAVDFNVQGMTDGEVAIWIAYNKDKLPYNMRLERDTVGWTHLDCFNNGNKLTCFKMKPLAEPLMNSVNK